MATLKHLLTECDALLNDGADIWEPEALLVELSDEELSRQADWGCNNIRFIGENGYMITGQAAYAAEV